ncbi:MAG: CHAT domain-containing protein [Pseudomonadota bacterium]
MIARFLAGFSLCAVLACPGAADQRPLSESAFEGAQWVLATEAARAVSQVGARLAAGEGPLADKIRARQEIELRMSRIGGDVAAQEVLRALQAQLGVIDAEIREAFPDYDEFANPRPLSYADVRADLAADEALVLFLTDRTATFVWAVTPDGVAWHRSPLTSRELGDLVRRVRADLDPTGLARAAAPMSDSAAGRYPSFDGAAAHQLYSELFAPLAETLAPARHVYVVKDGPLSSLPFSVLLTEPWGFDGADDFRTAPWLIARHAFTTLPAVSSLPSAARSRALGTGASAFVGFGDPDFGGDPTAEPVLTANRAIDAFFDAGGTQLDAIRKLAPLPGTARELRQIAALFPEGAAEIRLGVDATEAAVKATDFQGVSILSFATHGLVTGDITGLAEPALAFAPPIRPSDLDDGLLTASEAAALDLDADWVILSACNTAAGDGTPGAEGLSGLARAFLFAGARSILVSHWPVRDDVAAILTADTIERLNADGTLRRSEALRGAILDLMVDAGDPTRAHPSAWAPFVLVGAGGRL